MHASLGTYQPTVEQQIQEADKNRQAWLALEYAKLAQAEEVQDQAKEMQDLNRQSAERINSAAIASQEKVVQMAISGLKELVRDNTAFLVRLLRESGWRTLPHTHKIAGLGFLVIIMLAFVVALICVLPVLAGVMRSTHGGGFWGQIWVVAGRAWASVVG